MFSRRTRARRSVGDRGGAWTKRVGGLGLLVLLAGCGDVALSPDGSLSDSDGGLVRLDGGDGSDAGMLVRLDSGIPGDGGSNTCELPTSCEVPLPPLGPTDDWRHTSSSITAALGSPRHRGRDLYLTLTDPQWALAKFSYGATDDDIRDEDVDVYLQRDCGSTWESLGTVRTTRDGDHATVEGVEDTGGRVYLEIPAASRLGVGRHRVLFVVRGDHTMATQYIEVLPASARFVVTDVDGTQTESETAEWGSVFAGADVAAQPSGPELLWAFAERGYRIFYLTARPEWLTTRTHEWLLDSGYPPGEVHTTLGFTGALGGAAVDFKRDELNALLARFPGGVAITIGNTDTDAEAAADVGMAPASSWLYQFDPGASGTEIDDYADQIPVAQAMPLACF